MYLTQEEAETELRELQKILRLQDWDIKVEVVDNLECFGETSHEYKYKQAVIKLLSEKGLKDKNFFGCQRMDFTLGHELLHVQFCGVDKNHKPNSLEAIVFENAVEFTAQAIVKLRQRLKELERK